MASNWITPTRCNLLLPLLLLLSFTQSSIAQDSSHHHQAVEELPPPEDEQIIYKSLPIFPKILSPPIFYTTFFPIIFEYQLPQWEEADLRIKWPVGHSNNCNGTDAVSFWNQVGCPSVYYYNTVIGKFFEKTTRTAFGTSHNENVRTGFPTLPISCDVISPHFASSSSSKISWEYYWKLLGSCPARDLHKESISLDYGKIDLTKLDLMLRKFYDLYAVHSYNHYSYVGGSVYTASYSAFQSTGLLEHFVEMQKWSDSLSLCHSGKLSRHLVGYTKLRETLNIVSGKIDKGKSYTASISDDATLYYKLPLTDCTRFAANDTFLIRTLVPIRPLLKSNFSLIELQSIPFTQNFNASSPTNLICGMNEIRGVYAVDQESGNVQKSDCKSGQLCLIKQNEHHWVDPCLSAIFSGNKNGSTTGGDKTLADRLSTSCRGKMACQSLPTTKFPLFSRLSSNILAIVGYSAENIEIFISCNGNPYKVIKPSDTGALLVQLSCSCKVVHKFEEYHAQEPCNSVMKIQHANFSYSALSSQNDKMENVGHKVENNVGQQQINNTKANISQIKSEEHNCIDENWLWMLFVWGLFGFTSFIWNIIASVMARNRGGHLAGARSGNPGANFGNTGNSSSDQFEAIAYRANRQGTGLNDNPMAYLVQKEQNIL